MGTNADKPEPVPVLKTCARCGYSLRGLLANRACPECGLRFDERCALYGVTNPRQLMVFRLMVFGGGWVALKHLPHVANLAVASAWEMIGALAGAVWIVCVPIALWFIVRSCCRGLEVAITSDGLIVRLPGFSDELIPWRDIGGVANVFPKRADAEQFIRRFTERLDAADVEAAPHSSSGSTYDDATGPRM
jgi:hypothetical protein